MSNSYYAILIGALQLIGPKPFTSVDQLVWWVIGENRRLELQKRKRRKICTQFPSIDAKIYHKVLKEWCYNDVQHSILYISVRDTVEECVKNADLVVLATFASQPILFRRHLKNERVLVMAVGAARPTMREMGDDLMNQSDIYVDSLEGAM